MRAHGRALGVVAMALAVLAGSACSGPRNPIDVAVKEMPGDVAIGKKPVAATSAPPAVSKAVNPVPIGFPSFIQPPPPIHPTSGPTTTTTTAKPLPPPPCRAASPFDTPEHPAPNNVTAPPAEATLPFRNEGTFEKTTSDGRVERGRYPEATFRVVSPPVTLDDGTFKFTVAEQVGLTTTATVYHLVPTKGLYLSETYTLHPDGSEDRFVAATDSLLLLPLPVTPVAQVGGVAVDATSATTMSLVGTVVGHTRVDACGTLLDAWEVDISDGRITSAGKQVHFKATFAIGTQYGGLSLGEHVEFDCDPSVNQFCDNGANVTTKNTASASREPTVVVASA